VLLNILQQKNHEIYGIDLKAEGPADRPIASLPRCRPPPPLAVVALIMMVLEDSEDDWDDDSKPKWKHKELGQPIRWTGPPILSPSSPVKTLLNVVPTKAEIEEHQRVWNEAYKKYVKEQLRKLPLLAQEYGIDTRSDAWVLGLLLALAPEVVPGFRLDFGSRRGARKWDEGAQAELIADIEAVKHRWQEQGRKCSDLQACRILVSNSRYRPRYGRFSRGQSRDKRARSLNTRLVEARNAKTWVARLLTKADGELKQMLTAQVISLFTCDPQEAASAKARHAALSASANVRPRAR
jgi:hypothetical protein